MDKLSITGTVFLSLSLYGQTVINVAFQGFKPRNLVSGTASQSPGGAGNRLKKWSSVNGKNALQTENAGEVSTMTVV